MLIGPVLTAFTASRISGASLLEFIAYVDGHRYLLVYLELFFVGLIPVLFSFVCGENFSRYGVKREGIRESSISSILFVIVVYGVSYALGGQIVSIQLPSFDLNFPWSLWYTVLGLIAYGPLEVFFVVWLIENTDQIFDGRDRTLSWGLIVTVSAFALLHVLTTNSIVNALGITIIFLFFGMVYKTTENSIGPMIAWTLVNRQAILAATILFT
jgi:membrane protease YdiL (CAAX protease family)